MLGSVITFNSIFMMSFPKKLPTKKHLVYDQCETNKFEEKIYKANDQPNLVQKENYSKLQIEQLNSSNNISQLNEETTDHSNNLKQNKLIEKNDKHLNLKLDKKDQKLKVDQNSSFFNTIKRLLKNRILLCRIASTVFHILPVSGLYTFLPKYLEYQYRITASDASFLSGIAGILVMGLGM